MRRSVVAPALVLLAGCVAYRPTIAPPRAAMLDPADFARYDCVQLEGAIVRTDTVRWVIRADGAMLETDRHRVARYTANVVIVPLLKGAWPDGGHAVLSATDRRLVDLLRAKRAKHCTPTPSADATRTDRQVLDALEPLLDAGTRSALDERTRLLDALRVPLPPVLSPRPPAPAIEPVRGTSTSRGAPGKL